MANVLLIETKLDVGLKMAAAVKKGVKNMADDGDELTSEHRFHLAEKILRARIDIEDADRLINQYEPKSPFSKFVRLVKDGMRVK